MIPASCFGACSSETAGRCTHLLVRPDKVLYRVATDADLDEIIREHVGQGQVVERLRVEEDAVSQEFFELYGDVAFFNRQSRIALRHNGVIDPASIEEYFHYRGFEALAKVLEQGDPQWVIEEVTRASSAAAAAADFPPDRSGRWPPPRRKRPATSSATPTKATPARSWTAACSNPTPSTWSRG